MKMKRRLMSLISILLVLSLGLTACSSSSSSDSDSEDTTEETTEEETESEETEEDTEEAEEETEEETEEEEESDSSSSGENVEITFWYAFGEDYIEDAVERFNEEVGAEEGITVTAEYQGTYEDTHQKYQAAYISGTAPELCVVEIAEMRRFAEGGMIVSLDDYVEEYDIDIDDFYDGFLENCYVDDTLYGLPYLRSTSITCMNLTLLEEAGVDADSLETWDDIIDAATAVTEATGAYGMTYNSYDWTWEAFMLSYGDFTVNEDETECTIDCDTTRTLINMFLDLEEQGVAHLVGSADTDSMYSDIMTGNTAFFWGSTGSLTAMIEYAESAGYELGAMFIPAGTQNGVTTGGCNIVLTEGLSEEKAEAAMTFMTWLTSEEETVTANITTGYLTTRESAADDERMLELYEEYPQYEVALDQLQYAQGRPSNTGYTELGVELESALDLIWNGADIDETLADLQEKGTELLNE